MTILQSLVILCLAMLSSLSWACSSPARPHANDAQYSSILLGEVVGLRLTQYTAARQKQMREGSQYAPHGWGGGYEVEVLPIEIFKSTAEHRVGELVTLRIPPGCAIPVADLNQYGVFFLTDQHTAMPLYQDDLEYKARLASLGSQNVATCTTGTERLSPHPCWKPRAAMLQCLTFVKDVVYATHSSCPSGVQELRERMHHSVLGRFDWQMPPLDPSKMW